MSTDFKGYRGVALAALEEFKAPVWSDVLVTTDKGSYAGIVAAALRDRRPQSYRS